VTYGLGGEVTGTAKALSITGKAIRSVGAAGLSAASLSSMAQIDNGESRFAHMAKDFVVGGMFEVVGMPLMRKAWTAEIGEKVARDATEKIARDLGTSSDIVATHIDALRAGGVGADIRVVNKLEEELRKNSTAAASPLGAIVSKAKADWFHSVLPSDVNVNPNLRAESPNFGIRGIIEQRNPTTGETQQIPFWFQSDPADRPKTEGSHVISKFEADTTTLRTQVDQMKRAGFEVKMAHAEVQHRGAWTRFSNIFYGQDAPKPVFTDVKKGTFAATSVRPTHGQSVRDDVTGKIVSVIDPASADDVLKGEEITTALKHASRGDLLEALAAARESKDLDQMKVIGAELSERTAARVKALGNTLKAENMISPETEAELLTRGYSQAEIDTMAKPRAERLVREDFRKPGSQAQDLSTPKGIQGPLFKWDESSGSRSTNEMGVGGFQRRSGENTLVRLMNAAKRENTLREVERRMAAGQLTPEAEAVVKRRAEKGGDRRTRMQKIRDDAHAYSKDQSTLSDEAAGRPKGAAEKLAEARASLAKNVELNKDNPYSPSYSPFEVQVRTDGGKVERRTLAQLTPVHTVLEYAGMKGQMGLKPHSTGEVRHGVIDLQGGKVELEAFDNPSKEWENPAMKIIVDDDHLVGHQPRIFLHNEGVTFSIANTQQYDPLRGDWKMENRHPVLGYEAKVTDVGPIDSIAAYQHPQKIYTTTGAADLGYRQEDSITRRFGLFQREKALQDKEYTFSNRTVRVKGGITAGDEVSGRLRSRRAWTETEVPGRGETLRKKTSLGNQYETFASQADEFEAAPKFDAGFSSSKATDYGAGDFTSETHPRTLERTPNELEPGDIVERPPSFAISKETASQHLEMASAKRMAKVMIEEGADPSTKVRITISGGQWDDLHAPFEWSLGELSTQRFRPVAWHSLTAVAQSRGYQAIPNGYEVLLRSAGRTTRFPSGEEALSFLTREPRMKKYSPVLEKDLLEAWAAGGAERATDHPIDTARYRAVKVQESSINEVVGGRSPATLISSRDEESLRAAVQGLAKSQNVGGRFEILNLDPVVMPERTGKVSTVVGKGKNKVLQAGATEAETTLPPADIPHKPGAKDTVPEPSRFIVYEENSVRAKLLQQQKTLKKMGIDLSKSTQNILFQLSQYGKGRGIDFLFGNRDAGDALLYAQLRQWNKPSLFRLGGIRDDAHGAFRTYGPELREKIGAQLAAKPPLNSYDPALTQRLRGMPQGPETINIGGKKVTTKLSEPMDRAPGPGDEGVPDELHDIGDLLSPIGGGSGDERPPLLELTPDMHEQVEKIIPNTRGYKFLDIFRVPMQLFKEYQAATGIPFYRWWEEIDHGRTQVTRFTNPVFNQIHALTRGIKAAERQQVGQLFELRYSDPTHFARIQGDYSQFSELAQKGEKLLDSTMRKFLTDMDLDPDKELAELPFFRKHNITEKEMRPYESGRPPSPITRKSSGFMEDLAFDEREYDFSSTMKRYATAIAHEKFLAPQWEAMNKTMGELMGTTSDPATEHMLQLFNRHRAEAMHAQDRMGYGMAIGIQNVAKRLKMDLTLEQSQDIINTFAGANYFANLAFNVGVTARNYLQTLQTVFPVMGSKATSYGIKKALEWKRDPALRKSMEALDIVNTDTMLQGLSNIQKAVLESDTLSHVAKPLGQISDLMSKGVAMYQSADDFNKVAAYHAQYFHAEKAAKEFLEKGNWEKFLVDSKLQMRDIRIKDPQTGMMVDGPLMTNVKNLLAEGKPATAAHVMALDFAKESQFLYSRGNAPAAMQGTVGRLLFQYGTWPAWYVEWVGNNMMFRRGSKEENLKNIARWAGVNATLYYGMSEVFGVDFARWTFFAPLSYQGGPLAQIAQEGMATFAAKTSGDDDPVARIQAKRLGNAWKQLVPFPTVAARGVAGAAGDLMDGEYAEGVKKALGLPSTDKRKH
jgi:hypothetical protein